ncbi:MAG: hypothetical protein CVV64_07655 [Candidatus Wallbacteria bacterium HGW-Wallbacteria-1]|uniref:PHA accumulation regulator DNA-binding N-terminal domain-containing protein n=1 Tax=Candidatus Wallbacteria bacterium HGW-Wallbacteria-1 TaxID=2013854 RepID=A0A2N1PQX0_9BACT|nr:MAG: hypothetical protein CVV64_07655 [Candidatus Wallbacteria bacterium HGW-Wallbacteria-1]
MAEILIKKYDNRRLYCVDLGKYVSLSEIRDIVSRGDDIKVIEKTTGKDITGYVLTQILLEDRYDVLPLFFLKILIQAPRNTLSDFFANFFPGILRMYSSGAMGNQGQQFPWGQNQPQQPFGFQNPFVFNQQFPFPFGNQGPMPVSNPFPFGSFAGQPGQTSGSASLNPAGGSADVSADDSDSHGRDNPEERDEHRDGDDDLLRQMKELAERLAELEGQVRKKQ